MVFNESGAKYYQNTYNMSRQGRFQNHGNDFVFLYYIAAVKYIICYNGFMERIIEPIKLTYYMVFVTRYKRTVFNDKESAELVKSALLNTQEKGFLEIKSLEMGECYVNLICDCDPSKSPNQIVSILKRASYQALLKKIPHLNSIWARDIILRTFPISENELKSFLMTIKRRG